MSLTTLWHADRAVDFAADELLRRKIRALMRARNNMSQTELSDRIGMNQSLLSRRLSGVQKFQITDLDALATAFGITVPELFFDEYGQWDRRSGSDRRKADRRTGRQTIYDPKVELTPTIARLGFPTKNGKSES